MPKNALRNTTNTMFSANFTTASLSFGNSGEELYQIKLKVSSERRINRCYLNLTDVFFETARHFRQYSYDRNTIE